MTLDPASLAKLEGLHPDLVKVVERAAANGDVVFVVSGPLFLFWTG